MLALDQVCAEKLMFSANISIQCDGIETTVRARYEDIFELLPKDWTMLGVGLSSVPMITLQLEVPRVVKEMVGIPVTWAVWS